MLPTLFEWHGIRIYSYGAAILAAAALGGLMAWYLRPRNLFTLQQFLNICLLTTIGSTLGSRLAYLIEHGQLDVPTILPALRWWEKAGLASVGVPMIVLPLLLVYFRWQRLPTLGVMDYLFPFTVFGAAFQRTFGCFLAGCCRGKVTTVPWGVIFPDSSFPVHPTQLYLGITLFAAFVALVRWRPEPPGRKSLATVGFYALINLAVNFLRADVVNSELLGMPRIQWIYGGAALLCALGYYLLGLRADHRHAVEVRR